MTSEARLPVLDHDGHPSAQLMISCLPGPTNWHARPLLIDLRGEKTAEAAAEAAVQLLEEAEYSYNLSTDHRRVAIEPRELFDPSGVDGLDGRLRPGRSTGTVTVTVLDVNGVTIGACEFEVRARKLDYLSEYRWMLQRIAGESAEVVQSRFAASSLGVFRPNTTGSAETLYQRFVFVQSVLASEEFRGAIQLVLHRPHHEYRKITRERDPSRGIRAGRNVARQLVAPGPRQPLPIGHVVGGLGTLPRSVLDSYHVETYDTVPNRFVQFALEQWRDLAGDVEARMARQQTPAAKRGVREAGALRRELELLLMAPLFRGLGQLETFPGGNTVLQGRAGYRDVLLAFLQAEAAAIVDWPGGDTVFAAGQRDVATLYEYWVFFELLRIVESCSDFQVDRRPLFRLSDDKLSLELRRGRSVRLKAHGIRRNRVVELELWFNRRFSGVTESWTEPMRPDCSLRISPANGESLDNTTWLHFDAKYRVHSYTEIFRREAADELTAGVDDEVLAPVPEDLLKMHAYRDAIRRTSGAFVLYPGRDADPLRMTEYHEILPGLGAFVLRPTSNGRADESSALSLAKFIDDVIDHVAAQGTDQQRADYWTRRTYHERFGHRLPTDAKLTKPPADTKVLLGFVKSDDHQAWIVRTGLYNLRADGRRGSIGLNSPELASDLLCLYRLDKDDLGLYGLEGSFVLKTGTELWTSGYPTPRGALYCCVVLSEEASHEGFTIERVRELAQRSLLPESWGTPRVATWSELHSL